MDITLDYYGGRRSWFLASCDTKAQAVRQAVRALRRSGGRARISVGLRVVRQRG